MHALVGSGSDIVSGGVLRFDGARTWASGLHAKAILETRIGTHIRATPSLVYDTTAWNKVFRRSFLLEHDLRFPEGVYYEDIPLTVPAHFLASSVDVITQPVYLWRERQTLGQSITQRRAETRNLVDRMAAVASVDRFLAKAGDSEGLALHERKALTLDVPLFVDVLHEGDEEFFRTLMAVVGDYVRSAEPAVLAALPPMRRLQYHLIAHGMAEELKELVDYLRTPANRGNVVRKGVRLYADLPFLGDSAKAVPDEIYEVTRSQPLVTGIRDLVWTDAGLRVDGHAFIHRVSDTGVLSTIHRLQLRRIGAPADVRRNLASHRTHRPDLTARTTGAPVSYDGSGFVTTIPADALRLLDDEDVAEYELLAQVASPSARRGSAVSKPSSGRALHPRRAFVASDQLAIPAYRGRRLRIAVRRLPGIVLGAHVEEEQLVLSLRALPGHDLTGAFVHVRSVDSPSGTTAAVDTSGGAPTARVPLASLRIRAQSVNDRFARMWLVLPPDGRSDVAAVEAAVTEAIALERSDADLPPAGRTRVTPLELDPGVPEVIVGHDARMLVLERRGLRGTGLRETRRTPVVTGFAWRPEGLLLSGQLHGSPATSIELVNRTERHRVPISRSSDAWTATIPGDGEVGSLCLRWLQPGRWRLLVADAAAGEGMSDLAVRVGASAEDDLEGKGHYGPIWVLARSTEDHQAEILVDGGGDWRDRGTFRRERARKYGYRLARRLPRENAIFFEAWRGKQYSDNPRAIHEELLRQGDARRMVWAVTDHAVEVPAGVETVLTGGRDYYQALGRARFVISNDSMPPHYVKRRGSRYGQTWHGTPLKRIGFDIENLQMSNRNYLVQFEKEKEKWDALVSPNAFSSEILARAFRYDGPILEIGYPRNDIFFREAERSVRAAAARARLDLPEGKRVVLYAPTWRDNEYNTSGQYQFAMKLDLEQLYREFADEAVILVRGHQLVAARIDAGLFDGFVRNVSSYPDISDLYLLADVLITDYSSVMFDYVNTGRPMIFYTYDLESYRDQLRGFYFDFEAEAPGPLVTHTSEVIEALRDLGSVAAAHADRYAAFRQHFAALEDGRAAERFVDQVLRG